MGQNLTGAAFLAKVLGESLAASEAPEAAHAAQIEKLLNETIAQTRSVAKGLCPVHLHRGKLVPAVAEMASATQKLYGVSCTFQYNGDIPIDTITATHLYHIIQEAVNNAMRHGKAENVQIALSGDDHTVRAVVQDNGVGLPKDEDESEGMGLRIMRNRARMIGASLHISSAPGRGTTVECSLQRPARSERS